jgi:hypothetical protein
MRITEREQVQAGDVVAWGALGHMHSGVADSAPGLWDGQLTVGGGIDWWANFLWADRPGVGSWKEGIDYD